MTRTWVARFFHSTVTVFLILIAAGWRIDTAGAVFSNEGYQDKLRRVYAPGGYACPPGMLAYWELEESGDPYLDSFGDHDSAHTGTPPVQVVGKFGNAQHFSSTTTGIDAPSDADFDWGADDSFSIEFWVKPDVDACQTHSRVVVGRDDGEGVQWWVGCSAVSGKATFQLDDSEMIRHTVQGVNITDGAWHHIVAVRDGSNDVNYLYVDNVLNSISADTYMGDFTAVTASNVNIGWINHRIDSPGIHRFLGTIDEVAIYNRPLSDDQVSLHFQGGQSGMPRAYCDVPTDVFIPIVSR